ncbi:cardiomyopathy-associated protein 5 isoform X2 [Microcaecilia unicolor]|uniref:Cardiomyopathy-associated protein 5 isoform X2 n=1 Tax=Microcaecilia unicolor TaxID=1415580 RepID=A0A6P7X9B4_9AMPH|nr:cardiomyopathy-associated protein 5 isoform X2 [Microcaecilia unicolor]
MEGPGPADGDRASEVSFSIDEEIPEGVLEPQEAEELTSSLKDITQSEDVKPKLQCIMSNPSFSMVTVQCEDSGIIWETSSSRCSTPWASEASTTSDVYSMESSSVGSPPGRIVFIMDEDKIRRKKVLKSSGRALLSSRVKGDLSHKRHYSFESRVQESKRVVGTKDSECKLGIAEEPISHGLITTKSMSKEDTPQTGIPTYKAPVKSKLKKIDSVSEYPQVPPCLSQKPVPNAPDLSTKVKREENTVLKGSLNQTPSSSYFPQPEHFDFEKEDTTIHNVQPDLRNTESNEMSGNHISRLDRTDGKQKLSYLQEESHLITEHAKSILPRSIDEAAKQNPSLPVKAVNLVPDETEPISYVTDEAEKQVCLPITTKFISEQPKPLSHPTDDVEKEEIKVYSPKITNIASKEASLTEKSNKHEIYLPFSKTTDSAMDEAAFTSYFEDETETKNVLSSMPEIENFIIEQKKSTTSYDMDKTEKQDIGVSVPVTSEFKSEEAQCLVDEIKNQDTHLYSPVPAKQKSKQSKSISPFVMNQADEKTSPSSLHEQNTDLEGSLNQTPSSSDFPQPEHFDIENDDTTIHKVQPDPINTESNEMSGQHISPIEKTDRKQSLSYLHEESYLIKEYAESISSCPVNEAAKQGSPSLLHKAVNLVSEEKEPIPYVTDEAEEQVRLPAKLLSEQSKSLLSHPTEEVEKEEMKVSSPEMANIESKEASLTEKSNQHEICLPFSKTVDSVMDEAAFTSYFEDDTEPKNILSSIPEIVNLIIEQKKSTTSYEMDETEKQDIGVSLPVTSEFKSEEAQCLTNEIKNQGTRLYSPVPAKRKSKQSKSISLFVMNQAEEKTSPSSSHEQNTDLKGSLNQTPFSSCFPQPEHFDFENDDTTFHNVQHDLRNTESNEMSGNHILPLDRTDRKQNLSYLQEESHLITEHAKSILPRSTDEAAKQGSPPLPPMAVSLVPEEKEPIPHVTDEAEKQVCLPAKLLSEQSKPLLSHPTQEVEKEEMKVYSPEMANIESKEASLTEKSNEHEICLPFSNTADSVMDEAAFTSYFEDETETKNVQSSMPEIVSFIIEQKKSTTSYEMDETEKQDIGVSLPVTSEFKSEEAQCLPDEIKNQGTHLYSPVPAKRKSKQSKSISTCVVNQAQKKTSPSSSQEQNSDFKGSLNQIPFSSDFPQPQHFDIENDGTTIHKVQPDPINTESNKMSGQHISPIEKTDRKQSLSYLHEESYIIKEYAESISSCPVDEAAKQGSPNLLHKAVNLVSEEKEPIPYATDDAEEQMHLPIAAKLLSEQSKPLLSHPTEEVEMEEVKVYSPQTANIESKEASLTEKSNQHEICLPFSKTVDSVMDEAAFTSYFEDDTEPKNVLSSIPEIVNLIIEQKKSTPSYDMAKTEKHDIGVSLPVTSEFKSEEAQCLTNEIKNQGTRLYSPVPAKRKSKQSKSISPFVISQAEEKTSPSSSHEQNTDLKGSLNQTSFSSCFPQPEHFDFENDDTTFHNVQHDLRNTESNEMSGNHILPLERKDRKEKLSYLQEESLLFSEPAKSISSCPVVEAVNQGSPPLPPKAVNLVSEEKEPNPYITDEAEKQVCMPIAAKLLSEQSERFLSHLTEEVEKEEIKDFFPETTSIASKEASLTEKSNEHEIYVPFSKTADTVMDEAAFTSYFEDEMDTKNVLSSIPEIVSFIIEQKKSTPSYDTDKTEKQDTGVSLPVTSEFKSEEAQSLSSCLTDETKKQGTHLYSPVPAKRKSKQSRSISSCVMDQAEKKTSLSSSHEQITDLKGFLNQIPSSSDYSHPEHFDFEKDDTGIHNIQPDIINVEFNEMSRNHITALERIDRKQKLSYSHEESFLFSEPENSISSCPVVEAAKQGSPPLPPKAVNLVSEEKEPIPYITDEAEKQVCMPIAAKLLSEQSERFLSHLTEEVEKEEIEDCFPETASIASKEASLTEKSNEHEIYVPFSKTADTVMNEAAFTSYFEDETDTKNVLSSIPEIVSFIIEQKKSTPSYDTDKTEKQDTGVSLPVTSEFKSEEAQHLSSCLTDETKKQGTHLYSPVPAKRKSKQSRSISSCVMDQAEKKTSLSSSHEEITDLIGSLNQIPSSSDFPHPEHFDFEKDDTAINVEFNEMSRNHITPLETTDRKQKLSYLQEEAFLFSEPAKSISSCPVVEAAKQGSPSLPPKAVNLVFEAKEPIPYVTDEAEKQVCLPIAAKLLSEMSKPLLSHVTEEVENEEIKVVSPEIANRESKGSKEASLTEKSNEHEIYLPFSKVADSVMDEAAFTSYFEDEAETKSILSSLPEIVNFIVEQKKSVSSYEMDKTEKQDTGVSLPVTSEFKHEEAQCLSSYLTDEKKKQGSHLYSPVPAKRKSKQPRSSSSYVMDQAEKTASPSFSHEVINLRLEKSCDLSVDHVNESEKQGTLYHSSGMVDTLTNRPDLPLTPDLASTQFSNNRQTEQIHDTNEPLLYSPVTDKVVCNLFSDRQQIPSVNEIAKEAEMVYPPNIPATTQLKEPGEILRDTNDLESQTNVFSIVSEGYEILNILAPPQISSVDQEESKHMQDKLEYLEENPIFETKPLLGVGDKDSDHQSDANIVDKKKDGTKPKELLIENDTGNKELEKEVTPVLKSQKSIGDMDYFEKYTLIDDNVPTEVNIKTFPDKQALVDVVKENPEKAEECVSLTKSSDVGMLESEYYDFDEAFYGTTKENDLPSPLNSRKVLKVQKTFDSETKADKNTVDKDLKSEGKSLFTTEEGVLTRSPFFPVNVKYIDPELLEEPPALAFLYKDLYEDATGDTSKKNNGQSDEDSLDSETSLPCRNSDTDDGTGIYFEKYILRDEIPVDVAESQKTKKGLTEVEPEQLKVSEVLNEELLGNIPKGITDVYEEKEQQSIYVQKEENVRDQYRLDVQVEEKNNLFVRNKICSAHQTGITCETSVSREDELTSFDPCETADFQNVQLKKGVYKSSERPDLFEKCEEEGKINMYGLDNATKLITEDGTLQSVEENMSPLSKFEIHSDKVIDNLGLQNSVCQLEDIQRPSETKREQRIDYSEEAEELMDYDVITHDELLQDELLSDYTNDEVIFSEDRESFDHASESTYDFVSDAELHVPSEHEQEDSGFEIIDSEMLTTELSENYSEKELKKSQINTYCYTCRCPISAIDKIFGAHKDHEVTSLDNVVAEMMGRLEEFLVRLQESSIKAEERVGEIEALFNHVEENCSQMEKLLEEQNEEMIKKVIAQHTEKSQSFEEVKKMKMEFLYEQMVSLQQSIETSKEILEKSEKEAEEPDAVTLLSSFKEINARFCSAMENSISLEKIPSMFSLFEHYAESSGTSDENTVKHVSVPSTPKLQAQESNSATSTSVAVYWTVSEADVIDCFQVYCMEEPQGNREQNGLVEEYRVTVKESYCILEDLEPDKCYNVWVMAVNNTGCSLPSDKSIFRTAPSMPLIKAEDCTVCWDTAIIRWSTGNHEALESFTLEYCRQYSPEGEGLRSIAGIKGQELKVKVQPNENYFFYVRAVNAFGSSEQSEAALISTKGTRFHLIRETACPPLEISPDGTAMSITEKSKITGIPTVLGELLPARGWHYWETMVTGCKVFRIGACYSSTPGNWVLGENNTSWCMYCQSTTTSFSCRFLHAGVVSDVLVTECPVRIGTLLDYSSGRISFFSVQKGQLLLCIKHKFTEAVHPAFTLETPGQLHLHTGIETPEFVKHS